MMLQILNLFSSILLTRILCCIILTFFFKYILDKFRKDPRLVQFAKTLPGPSFNSDLFLADSSISFVILVKLCEE